MKRIILALATFLLMVVLFSFAEADVFFQTGRFEFVMPDTWFYNEAGTTYAKCNHSENNVLLESFQVYDDKKSYKLPEKSSEEIADIIIKLFGIQEEYSPTVEEMEISGEKHIVVRFKTDRMTGCATILNTGSYYADVLYMAALGYEDIDLFKKTAASIKERPKEDAGYFRFGNAEVMYKGYRTKKVGKQTYLLLDFDWRNIGTAPDMFVINVDVTAYQDGIELSQGFLFGENTETGTNIMPGKNIKCTMVYTLRNPKGDITLFVDKLMDMTNEYVGRKIQFTIK